MQRAGKPRLPRLHSALALVLPVGAWFAIVLPVATAEEKAPPPVRASRPEVMARAREELLGLQSKIRQLREEALKRRRTQLERKRELVARRRSIERTLEAVRAERDRLQQAREKKADELEELKGSLAGGNERAAALVDRIRRYLSGVSGRILAGIPWKQETRRGSVQQALTTLQGERPDPAAALGAAGRIQKEEEALARLVESGGVQLQVEGRKLAVSGFHLGLLAVVYANEEGTILGFAGPGETLAEGRSAVRERPAAADGYLKAVDILQRRRTPALVNFYLPPMANAPATGAGETHEEGADAEDDR